RASFGSLVPTGEYASLFENNRARFEAKWNVQWVPHAAPPDAAYDKLVERVRSVVASTVPTEALVAIASRGDQRLVEIPGIHVTHFPPGPARGYAGHYPATDAEAITLVEAARLDGVTHLAFPAPSAWWLEHYPDLRRHLETHGHLVAHDEETVAVYQLDPLEGPGVGTANPQHAASRQQ
ncbi:MAG TPA: hypothetical protein VMO88_10985, partial [Acidimicrobiales bacterium]|nr:hypothetical protein [Acidimicrobiales bacterium]